MLLIPSRAINYSPHMPGENCSEFGKANYSQDFEWMKHANINTIRTKSDLTSPVIDDFEDADIGDWFVFATPDASISLSSSNKSKVGNYSMRIDYNTCLLYTSPSPRD